MCYWLPEASAQSISDDHDVIPNDGYDYIDDVLQEHDAFDMISSGNRCPAHEPGYGDLLPPNQRESSTYFKIYHQSKPAVQYKKELIGPVDQGQAVYLDLQDSDCASESPTDAAPNYLELASDTGDFTATEECSTDYLNPCTGIQKSNV